MKTMIVLATLGLAGFTGASGAFAGDNSCAPPRHERRVHVRHHVERCWIAPRYETIVTGYDHCGRPVYRTVCVSEGYWNTRPVRCD